MTFLGGFSTTQTLTATLFDIRIFDDVRTTGEISANYDSILPHNESGLLANWTFNNLSTTGVVVDSVTGNNLTVQHVGVGGGYTTSSPFLGFKIDENSTNGTVVGIVAGSDAERDAQIATLSAADPNLVYSQITGKFYKTVTTPSTWTSASASALSTTLNGVDGQLATLRSAA